MLLANLFSNIVHTPIVIGLTMYMLGEGSVYLVLCESRLHEISLKTPGCRLLRFFLLSILNKVSLHLACEQYDLEAYFLTLYV